MGFLGHERAEAVWSAEEHDVDSPAVAVHIQ